MDFKTANISQTPYKSEKCVGCIRVRRRIK